VNDVTWWIALAAVFLIAATVEFVWRIVRGASAMRSLKDWLVKLIDTLSGGF
jgi:hypothetical protein